MTCSFFAKETRNGYIHLTHSKSKDEKHWPPNAGQQKLDTKVQRALEEKILGRKGNIGLQIPGSKSWTHKCKGQWRKNYWGEKKTFASKYRAAKAGHISAKGNGRKKLMGRKENIGL